MKPIVEAFVRNGNRYNLLHSAVLELLEYIRQVLFYFLSNPVHFDFILSLSLLRALTG